MQFVFVDNIISFRLLLYFLLHTDYNVVSQESSKNLQELKL